MSLHEPAWQPCLELGSEVGFRARLSRTPKLAFLLGFALEGQGMPHHDERVKAQSCSGHSQLQTAEASHAPRPLGSFCLFPMSSICCCFWGRACVCVCVRASHHVALPRHALATSVPLTFEHSWIVGMQFRHAPHNP